MKTDPRYGYYPWWPENDDDWVHPEDVAVARGMIPSKRIWRRDGTLGPFVFLHYGEVSIRVRPALWVEVNGEGIEPGDWVEVLSRMQKNTHCIGQVREMFWNTYTRSIGYRIQSGQQIVPKTFASTDLRLVRTGVTNHPLGPLLPFPREPRNWEPWTEDEPA
ncbi:MAG: hypothetical protein CMJ81_07430 [Planctomycetaceae bacterium]|nr:hypothetical protein [Planctomycetaceae bacterium]MBP62139.1 hypothetical protein [Planctomycetaceae bacterium]